MMDGRFSRGARSSTARSVRLRRRPRRFAVRNRPALRGPSAAPRPAGGERCILKTVVDVGARSAAEVLAPVRAAIAALRATVRDEGKRAFDRDDPAWARREAERLARLDRAAALADQLEAVLSEAWPKEPTPSGADLVQERPAEAKAAKRSGRLPNGPIWDGKALKPYVQRALAELGGQAHLSSIEKRTEEMLQGRLTEADLENMPGKKSERRLRYNISWALYELKMSGLAVSDGRGNWRLTDAGRNGGGAV